MVVLVSIKSHRKSIQLLLWTRVTISFPSISVVFNAPLIVAWNEKKRNGNVEWKKHQNFILVKILYVNYFDRVNPPPLIIFLNVIICVITYMSRFLMKLIYTCVLKAMCSTHTHTETHTYTNKYKKCKEKPKNSLRSIWIENLNKIGPHYWKTIIKISIFFRTNLLVTHTFIYV